MSEEKLDKILSLLSGLKTGVDLLLAEAQNGASAARKPGMNNEERYKEIKLKILTAIQIFGGQTGPTATHVWLKSQGIDEKYETINRAFTKMAEEGVIVRKNKTQYVVAQDSTPKQQ